MPRNNQFLENLKENHMEPKSYSELLEKISNETQASHLFLFTLLVMLGIYEPTCIEIPALSF